MSEVSSSPKWVGPILGGGALVLMSVGSSYYVERKIPATKIIARDFILGAILVLCIMQFLPESVTTAIASIMSVTSVLSNVSMPSMELPNGVKSLSFLPEGVSDVEAIKVGVPKF